MKRAIIIGGGITGLSVDFLNNQSIVLVLKVLDFTLR